MKKYFLSIVALAGMLFATSCQESLVEPQVGGTTTFTVQVPDQMGTKADEDSYKLFVEVYSAERDESYHRNEEPIVMAVGTPTTVTLNLVANQDYDIIFWAQKDADSYGVNDLSTVQMNDDHHNSETGAAFYAVLNNYNPTQGKQDVKLTRPFAQLNFYTNNNVSYGSVQVLRSTIKVTNVATSFNRVADKTYGEGVTTGTYTYASRDTENTNRDLPVGDPKNIDGVSYQYVSMDYLAVPGNEALVDIEATFFVKDSKDVESEIKRTFEGIPVQMNYRTNIIGNLITSASDFKVEISEEWVGGYDVENGNVSTEVNVDSAEELIDAFENEEVDEIILTGDINLNDLFNLTKSEVTTDDPTLTIKAGKTLTIDLNGKKLSATSSQSDKSYNMFDICGTLTIKNGTIEYEHKGENMGWNYYAEIFHLGFNGTLNLDGVTAINGGGSDMAYVIDMSNAENITVNVNESTLQSTYIPVRVFNHNKTGINNVNIKKSTLEGKYCFWVQYWLSDGYDKATLKNTVKLDIFNSDEEDNDNNKFKYDNNKKTPILAGYNEYVNIDAYGITKVVSEDGTEVTLGSLIEDGLVRRGDAGAEENTTIKKVVVEEGITTLYDRTFRRFYALEEVVLPEGLTTIGAAGSGVFQSCTALKNIVIPDSVTVLGKGTFQECASLESINIPSGVKKIEADCFRATGLKKVEFHAGVTYFGAQAFRDCKQLKEVIITAPEFTIEANAFGVMAGTLPGTTIYVANAEMKSYLESTLAYKNQFTIEVIGVSTSDELAQALSEQKKYIVLSNNISSEAATIAPYGNKYGYKMDGGILDGNDYKLDIECYGDDYGIMTSGGTIKNLTIENGTRAVMIMYAEDDVILDNVCLGGEGVLYPINTGEARDETAKLIVSNSTLAGWTSYSNISSASFTNVEFKQGTYYNNIYGRVLKPYVNTTLTNCSFIAHMNLDLSALTNGHKIVIENCTVNGQLIAADVFTVPSCDNDYDTKLFTVDLPSWATKISDCIEVK